MDLSTDKDNSLRKENVRSASPVLQILGADLFDKVEILTFVSSFSWNGPRLPLKI